MGLKLRLQWFDKHSELGVGTERSKDLQDDYLVMESLGLPPDENINNGCFEVLKTWLPLLQPHFEHAIDLSAYDYMIAFDYKDTW